MSAPASGESLTATDPMLQTVLSTPDQWARALQIARAAPLPAPRPRSVVVAGMGGSGIAGDVAALVGDVAASVPVVSVHGEHLPGFVGSEDLVVLVSHSGTTRETLTCAEEATRRGAHVVAVTSGGPLADHVAAVDGAVVEVPASGPPRASVALLTVPVLAAMDAAGVTGDILDRVEAVPGRLRELTATWSPTRGTGAPEQLAHALGPRIPLFLGSGPVPAVVAARARNQVAENAERPAHAADLPEADHNQLVGWAGAGFEGAADLVVLRTSDETPGTRRRVEATVDLARAGFAAVHEHRLADGDPIEQLAAGFLFVDLLSVHLALLAGVDPTPIAAIDELKRRL